MNGWRRARDTIADAQPFANMDFDASIFADTIFD